MNARLLFLLCLSAATLPVFAAGPSDTDASLLRAQRIVGAWANESRVGPCGGPVGNPGYQTLLFNAGGTVVDNPRFSPAGIPAIVNGIPVRRHRTIGVGTWNFDWRTRQYEVDQRFDWFINDQYDGYQTVHRTIAVSSDGNQLSGPVLTRRYAADGALTGELCGSAVSTRL